MKLRDDVGKTKLRGGFYSPESLVQLCLSRVSGLIGPARDLDVLEPAVGDGAFVRGLAGHELGSRIRSLLGVELLPEEAALARDQLGLGRLQGEVITANVLEWNALATQQFDVAVGNPPFVRFQFLSSEDRQRAADLGAQLGVPGSAVSNLWIPVFLIALSRLREGGAFSFIVPMELLTGVSAGRVRDWLLDNCQDLSIDLFKPGSFPTVLQEVVVLSGRRAGTDLPPDGLLRFSDHNGGVRTWTHRVSSSSPTWVSYLLNARQLEAWDGCAMNSRIKPLGTVARFSVSTVTGANSFFCVSTKDLEAHGLRPWAIPLLPRARFAPGLVYGSAEQAALAETESPSWLISFAAGSPSPVGVEAPTRYLDRGVDAGIHERFKCRTRDPWYRVPVVPPGDLLLSKRSNVYPRLIVNKAGVVTTDTIYRGVMLKGSPVSPMTLAASFHNSLTLLAAEILGRSFGGGVLELVPSEISSLLVPILPDVKLDVDALDARARVDSGSLELVESTDKMVLRAIPGLDEGTILQLQEAHRSLAERRLLRSEGKFYEVD